MEPWKTDAQKRAVKKYHDRQAGITIRVTPDQKKAIDDHLRATGEGMTAFLLRAAALAIEADDRNGSKVASASDL